MDETEQVLRALDAELAAGRQVALATIVATRGSTYRRPGARLLVREDATWLGNLSGGCLEGEILEVGQEVIDGLPPRVVEFDLTADEEAIWGWGLGCNGAIDVLVEGSDTAGDGARLLRRGRATGRPFVLATSLSGRVGAHRLLEEVARSQVADGVGELGGHEERVDELAAAALRSGSSTVVAEDGLHVALEVVRPPVRLLVCGAGPDSVPLVAEARRLGWDVTVVDDRSSFLDPQRYGHDVRFVRSEPRDAAATAGVDDLTHVVVMSHNFMRDVDYLGSFLGTGVAYLGMLGPYQRLERLREHLAEHSGIEPDDHDEEVLHGPAGLDLGAEGPQEIARAITAEVLAVSRGRDGGSLAERDGPIHP